MNELKNTTIAASAENADATQENLKFGTFGGVFTPSVLTILGVIMYLRLGWVVGHAGLIGTLIIISLSSAITFLTALSVSSVATDQKVKTGGAYYMISRSIGIEGGGAVGISLFIAQAFSVPLYTIGFAESVAMAFPGVNQKAVGFIVTLFVAALALKSARIAIRAQYLIMVAIAASLISLFAGHSPAAASEAASIAAGSVSSPGFWKVFAVFFPAVTGIMAGINMSGNLKNPAKSIPLGTIAAVLTGYIIYMFLGVLLYFRAPAGELTGNSMIMFSMARWPWLILAGIWGATLSSAIGSILGAPRVLQALARDGVLPAKLRWLGRGSGPADEPRNGTLFTLSVALLLVYFVDLNFIAPILTMFFLTTYFVLNLSAGIENFLKNPSFRPAFKIHWAFSMLGALGCVSLMFLINALATVAAVFFVFALYFWLKRRKIPRSWGDVRRGLWMMLVRAGLLNLDREEDPRNWRPNVLVLAGSPAKGWHLIEFADMITHDRGMFTVAAVLPAESRDAQQKSSIESAIKEHLNKKGIPALVRIISAEDTFTGAAKLMESYGLGPVTPNTMLIGSLLRDDADSRDKYLKLMCDAYESGKNTLIFNDNPEKPLQRENTGDLKKKIDVWWRGLEGNGGLMLLLADALRMERGWDSADLRLKMVMAGEEGAQAARENLDALLKRYNLNVGVDVIEKGDSDFSEIFRESSKNADIIFHGLPMPCDKFSEIYCGIQERLVSMPPTVLVLAGKNTSFTEIFKKE